MKIYQKLTSWKFMCLPSATSWSKPNGGNLKWQPAPLPIQFWCCRQRLLPVATLPRVAVAVAQLQFHSQHSLTPPLPLSLSVLHMSSKCSATNAPQNSRLRLQLRLPTAATTVPTLPPPLPLPPGLSLASSFGVAFDPMRCGTCEHFNYMVAGSPLAPLATSPACCR